MRDSYGDQDTENIEARMPQGCPSPTRTSSDAESNILIHPASTNAAELKTEVSPQDEGRKITQLPPFEYRPLKTDDHFRLARIQPGFGTETIKIDLEEVKLAVYSSDPPASEYKCLSYRWQPPLQTALILINGCRFGVTSDLLAALRSVRRPETHVIIWIDQICINQDDHVERAHQVSIKKHIYRRAKQVIVWLGLFEPGAALFEHVEQLKREDGTEDLLCRLERNPLPLHLQDTVDELLKLAWFTRVWVIVEVCLAPVVCVSCGSEKLITWNDLVELVEHCATRSRTTSALQPSPLGNPRQRIAIITDMMARQKRGLPHTDISQLLILAKSSEATDDRDKIYAFYGLTLIKSPPDYERSVEGLSIDTAVKYVKFTEDGHGNTDLSEPTRTFQLMSILYNAGALHQHHTLPSWVPDWTHTSHLTPFWAKTSAIHPHEPSPDAWTASIRSEYRAGGDLRTKFQIRDGDGGPQLCVSAMILDTVTSTSERAGPQTPTLDIKSHDRSSRAASDHLEPDSTAGCGRVFVQFLHGSTGLATPGVRQGDVLAVLLGADVPFILRPVPSREAEHYSYNLLCECFVHSHHVMFGDAIRGGGVPAEDILLV